MTEQTQTPNNEIEVSFASEQAGAHWAEIKANYGDYISIKDVVGGGQDEAIRKGDIDEYMKQFPTFESKEVLEMAVLHADDLGVSLNEFMGEELIGKVITGADIQAALLSLEKDNDGEIDVEYVEAVEPDVDGIDLKNLTGNTFVIEGVTIEPHGITPMTVKLAASKRVNHAVKTGVLTVAENK